MSDLRSGLWNTSPLYQNAVLDLDMAGKAMDLNPNVLERLKMPKKAMCVSIPVRMDDGSVKVFEGYRVQHSTTLGPGKGGYSISSQVNLSSICLSDVNDHEVFISRLTSLAKKGGDPEARNPFSSLLAENNKH